jgi:hypothetical protein
MKKQTVKKLRIGKETLLPLDSRQMREVVAGLAEPVVAASDFFHIDDARAASLYAHPS